MRSTGESPLWASYRKCVDIQNYKHATTKRQPSASVLRPMVQMDRGAYERLHRILNGKYAVAAGASTCQQQEPKGGTEGLVPVIRRDGGAGIRLKECWRSPRMSLKAALGQV